MGYLGSCSSADNAPAQERVWGSPGLDFRSGCSKGHMTGCNESSMGGDVIQGLLVPKWVLQNGSTGNNALNRRDVSGYTEA